MTKNDNIIDKTSDFITINQKDGTKKEAELVTKFEIQDSGSYVIYKIDGMLYGAKYIVEDGNTKLITDLTESEKNILNEVYSKLEVE